MKKHFSAGKQDLQTVHGNKQIPVQINFLNVLLVLCFVPDFISPQIPVRGFCKFNSFDIDTGYTNLLMVNLNDDSYSDLLIYNPQKKESFSLYGTINGEFSGIKKFSLPIEVNNLHPLDYKAASHFVFSNRRIRKTGIFEFRTETFPFIKQTIDFDSYPDFLSTADVNADGEKEILVSGGAFNGITLILINGNKLIKKNITKGTFSQAAFIELNNDGYPDIAAYDLINRSFRFFYNNSRGEFRHARSVPFSERPSAIKTFDINLDSYEDLIFIQENSINIWYGDFRSSYDIKKKINTKYKPDKYIYGDFNNDGLIDFVYLNIKQSVVSVLFAENEFDYFPEIISMQQEGLTDIIPFYSRFIDGIAAISSRGSIFTITSLSSFTDDVSISIGAKPRAISFFDNENNGITDFCFIDEFDMKIKFIVRDNNGIPSLYYSQQLFQNHEKIISENTKQNEKNYICFSFNKKLIEVVRTDFNNKIIEKKVIYSPGSILDLKVKRENDEQYKIFIVYKISDSLNLGIFNSRNFEFSFSSVRLSKSNEVIDGSVGTGSSINISSWFESEDKLSLYSYEPFNKKENRGVIYSISKDEIHHVNSFTGDLLNLEKNISISFINGVVSDIAVVSSDTLIAVIRDFNNPPDFRITSKNNLFFGETRFNGLKKLCAYIPEKNIITRLEFIRGGKNVAFSQLADISQAMSFFVKNMTSKNYHVVYSDPVKNCITVKRLKG